MRSIEQQVSSGQLVCPTTHERLSFSGDHRELSTADGARRYPVRNDVPVFLPVLPGDREAAQGERRMAEEYERIAGEEGRIVPALKRRLHRDYRSRSSIDALHDVLGSLAEGALALSVGGGPGRVHPAVCNVNLGAFLNVDVVGDAHQLPYADDCVDAIFCEAVLEHLRRPEKAVSEMRRTLKPGGRVLAITPFLQGYHGYPDHFRNYTLSGHVLLFEDAGFVVEKAGTCVGPVYTMLDLAGVFLSKLTPRAASSFLRKVWTVMSAPLHPLDRLLNRLPESHVLASTTFVVARKADGADSQVTSR